MITTWVLVISMYYDRSVTMAVVPNLRDLNECVRIQELTKKRAETSRFYSYCMETINK